MPRKISEATWQELKRLFCAGWSVRKLAARFNLPPGSISSHAAREKWSRERVDYKQPLDILPNGQIVTEDPELDAIRKIVHDCKRAALVAEAQTAKILAAKSLAAAEGLSIEDIESILSAQRYRQGVFPSDTPPHMVITFTGDDGSTDGRSVIQAALARGEKIQLVLHHRCMTREEEAVIRRRVSERHAKPAKVVEPPPPATEQIKTVEQNRLYLQQRTQEEQQRAEERNKYWSENPMPHIQQGSSTNVGGSALDRPAYAQSMNAAFLFSQYGINQINADRRYKGRTFGISGTIKSITLSEEGTGVELVIPYYAPELRYIRCIFNDSTGIERYQSGNPISLWGTVDGVHNYETLIIKDCHLNRD